YESGSEPSAIRLGAYYDISSNTRIAGLYQSASDVPGGDRNTYGIGFSHRMGDYTARAQYYRTGDNDTADTGANMIAVGIDRRFGRSTTLYAVYGVTSNDDAGNFLV